MGYHAGSRYTRYNAKLVRARKEHECCSCRRIIEKGELYESSVHPIYDFHGPPIGSYTDHRCTDCLAWEKEDCEELWRR
jgi:hypothetical protein